MVDAATIAAAVPLLDWLAMVEQSLRGVSGGLLEQGIRQILPLPDDSERGRVLSMMFGAVREPDCFGAKFISVFPDNFSRGSTPILPGELLEPGMHFTRSPSQTASASG